jgi:hypothetical protein
MFLSTGFPAPGISESISGRKLYMANAVESLNMSLVCSEFSWSKADLPSRIPGELYIRCRNGLLAGEIDRCLILLVSEAAVHLEVPADTFNRLEADIV